MSDSNRKRLPLWATLRRLALPTVLVVLGVSVAPGGAQPSDAARTEAEFLRQWASERQFFAHSLERKQAAKADPLQGLVESHTELTEHGVRLLHRLPGVSEDGRALGEDWLARAIEYDERAWGMESREAVSLAAAYLSESDAPPLELLIGVHALADGDYPGAEAALSSIPPDSPLAPVAQYDLALALVGQRRSDEAIEVLEVLRDAEQRGPRDADLRARAQLLQARLLFVRGRSSGARKLLRDFDVDDSYHERALWIEADDKLIDNRPAAALPFLLALSEQPAFAKDPRAQIALVETLERLGASRQATALGESHIRPLLRSLQRRQPIAAEIASRRFHRELVTRESGDSAPEHWDELGRDIRRMVTEIERTNSMLRLVSGNLEFVAAHQALLERGDRHLMSRLGGLRTQSLHAYDEHEVEESEVVAEVLWYEQLLSELVGRPEPRQLRYELLDGVSIWRFGYPFSHAWWRNEPMDRESAQRELERLLVEHRELRIQQDGDAYVERLVGYMKRAKRQGKRLLGQLGSEQEALGEHLWLALQRATPARREAEQALYWLAVASLPDQALLDEPRPEARYRLKARERAGERLDWDALRSDEALVRSPVTPAPIHAPVALEALDWLAHDARSLAVRTQASHYLAYLALEGAERLAGNATADADALRRAFLRAASLYERLVEMDSLGLDRGEALYQLARALDLAGRAEGSLAVLDRFAETIPEHRLADEVLFRRGELRFSLGDYDLAADSYRALIETTPQSGFLEEASYKLGWSNFKLGDHLAALDRFFLLVDRYWVARGGKGAGQDLLLGDTLRVISMTFANMGGIDSVNEYFTDRSDRSYTEYIYQDLGHYYERKRRYSDSADTFRVLGERFPSSERAPYYQSKVVDAYVAGGFPSRSWPARELFVGRFGVASEYWQQSDEPRRAEIRPWLEGYLQELAQRDHARAQSTGDAEAYRAAIVWYDQILLSLRDYTVRSEMLFLRGEALTEVGAHELAAASYESAAYANPGYGRGAEAAYAALLAYQQLYQDGLREEPGEGAEPEREDWLERGAVQSILFISEYPDAERTPWVRTKLAEDRLIQGSHGEAVEIAREQLEYADQVDAALELRLWRVIAHGSFDGERYAEAETAYVKASGLGPSGAEALVFHTRRVESVYKRGEQAEQAGDLAAAVGHFSRVADLVPVTAVHANARFDEATVLIRMERWSEATAVLEDFRETYPDHDLQDSILEKLVLTYEQTEQWDRAAGYLEVIYQRAGRSPLGLDALWRSAALWEKADQPRRAEQGYRLFIETFPEPLEPAIEARYRLMQLAEAKADDGARQYWLTAIMEAHAAAPSQATERTLYLASEAALTLGKARKQRFDLIRLELPLRESLRSKQTAMTESIKYLNRTLDYGLVEHGTEATVMIGEIYTRLADELIRSDRPAELSALELEQYEILLEEQAFPFEEQAIALHELNVGRIKDDVYDAWVARSIDALRELMPSRYDKTELVESHVATLQ